MSPTSPVKRRVYLVDRHYQTRFMVQLFWVVLATTVSGALACTLLWWRAVSLHGQGLQTALLTAALLAVAPLFFVELLLAIPIILALGLRQSHRVVGPVARFKRALQEIGEGDFTGRIHLRKSDELPDLAEAINQMAERLQRRFPGGGS